MKGAVSCITGRLFSTQYHIMSSLLEMILQIIFIEIKGLSLRLLELDAINKHCKVCCQ